MTGEVPADLLAAIRADAAQRGGVQPDSLTVVRGEAVVWPDGSLGCPQPGGFYTQAPVEGYWVVLAGDGVRFDYRATARGSFFLCERPVPRGLPRPQPGTPVD